MQQCFRSVLSKTDHTSVGQSLLPPMKCLAVEQQGANLTLGSRRFAPAMDYIGSANTVRALSGGGQLCLLFVVCLRPFSATRP